MFVGDLMTQIIERIVAGSPGEGTEQFIVDMGVGRLPQLALDYTDRNRTSPFAFTGNRFEFRAVGSSMNCAGPMAILLGAVADATGRLAGRLKAKLDGGRAPRRGGARAAARGLRARPRRSASAATTTATSGGRRRSSAGCPSCATRPRRSRCCATRRGSAFLREQGVFTEIELASRYNIAVERYIKHVTLEAETQLEMLRTFVIPAGEKQLAATLQRVARSWPGSATATSPDGDAGRGDAGARALSSRIGRLAATLAEVTGAADELEALLADSNGGHDEAATARRLADEVRPLMARARAAADRLEHLVDDELWSLPKYREMLFMR